MCKRMSRNAIGYVREGCKGYCALWKVDTENTAVVCLCVCVSVHKCPVVCVQCLCSIEVVASMCDESINLHSL